MNENFIFQRRLSAQLSNKERTYESGNQLKQIFVIGIVKLTVGAFVLCESQTIKASFYRIEMSNDINQYNSYILCSWHYILLNSQEKMRVYIYNIICDYDCHLIGIKTSF